MKDEFKKVVTRDKAAAEYFTSQKFLDKVRAEFMADVIKGGSKSIQLSPEFSPKKQDESSLREACRILQEEFPDLNHLRVAGAKIIADTKKNTLHRRITSAIDRNW